MSEMPERIWAGDITCIDGLPTGQWQQWDEHCESATDGTKFVRADIYDAIAQENKELREAVEGVCWQFGTRTVIDGKPCLHSGSLSDLEDAFQVLGWDDPHYYSEAEQEHLCCDVDGCLESSTCGTRWGNNRQNPFLRLCSKHYRESFQGLPLPTIKQHAIERESHRGENGVLRIQNQKENENE